MSPSDPASADPDPELPGPSAAIGTYRTEDEETVIYDEHRSEAWISSTYALALADVE
ncbi:DUF7331 family protein [Natronococcus occultus]|uniref:DUF7331 family protein n=1 Tax=Natronococcus occultus TaxID=29288 RepID=UPI001576549B|nr:hypothetical protein [Natronococcus occultus]